jgi:hypothetical protein
VAALGRGLHEIGLGFDEASRVSVERWAATHKPGSHGSHSYDLSDFGLDPQLIRECFASYCATFDVEG